MTSQDGSVWHVEVLPRDWSRAATDLGSRSALDEFYLAGGTGLALHIGHRLSRDLDLFRETEFSSNRWHERLRDLQGLRNVEVAPGTLHLELHGVKVSFLHYPYRLLHAPRPFAPLSVADPRDIACMKLSAIASRGSRRDFVDLYELACRYGLAEVLDWFEVKYASVAFSRTHLLKALTYFDDAEQEPMPDMLVPLEWRTVRQYFTVHAPRLTRLL